MKHPILLALFSLSIALLASQRLHAEQRRQCAPHGAVVTHLQENYDERRHMLGMTANGLILELFVAQTSGTWTITVTRPDGITCLVASGTNADLVPTPSADFDPEA